MSAAPDLNQRQEGFSLVELMVSITIGLILLLGLVTLLVRTNASHAELQKSNAQIENGRYATQLLHDDIQLAGYYGEYSPTGYTLPEKPCATTVTPTAPNMPSPIGYDLSSVAADFSCLTNMKSGTGVLVIRRVLTTTANVLPTNTTVTGATYLQVSQCNSDSTATPFVFAVADSTPSGEFTLRTKDCDSTKPASLRKFVVHIYYISSCNICAPQSNPDNRPTLKMVEYVDGAFQSPVALVEGIEDIQYDYGVDTDSDGSPDSYVADTDTLLKVTPANWGNVMAIRVNLLSRNLEPTAGYDDSKDSKTYVLGLAKPNYKVPAGSPNCTFTSVTTAPDCAYKRHLYSTLVRVENPSARREVP